MSFLLTVSLIIIVLCIFIGYQDSRPFINMQRARLKKSEEYTHSRHMDGGTEAQDPAGVYWEFQKNHNAACCSQGRETSKHFL